MQKKKIWLNLALLVSVVVWGLIAVAAHAENQDFDFGLPLFGLDEIRLEREKAPDFNLSLLAMSFYLNLSTEVTGKIIRKVRKIYLFRIFCRPFRTFLLCFQTVD